MQIEGKNSVLETIKANKTINKVMLQENLINGSLQNLVELLKQNKIKFELSPKNVLDKLSKTPNHQGVIAFIPDFQYCQIDDIFLKAKQLNEDVFMVILDEIEDPHNFGNIIRTCECAGVHGIITTKNHACPITETVYKASSGAINHILIAQVTNISDCINDLKSKNVWVYATDMDGQLAKNCNLKGNLAVVIGNEGNGVRQLTKKNCDGILKIEMYGKLNSLNASIATGIILWQALEQRKI